MKDRITDDGVRTVEVRKVNALAREVMLAVGMGDVKRGEQAVGGDAVRGEGGVEALIVGVVKCRREREGMGVGA